MDSSFSRVPSTGLQLTPKSGFSVASPSQIHGNNSYLPGYLLGGHTPSQMSYSHGYADAPYGQGNKSPYGQGSKSKSPGKMKSWSPSRSASLSRPSSSRERKDVDSSMQHSFSSTNQSLRGLRGKAPPVADLFSDTGTSVSSHPMDVHMPTQMSQTHSPLGYQSQQNSMDFRDHLFSPSRKTLPSPAQVDPFYSQGESITTTESLDECSITVFGFPPAASSFILQQFSQYGNILKHEVPANGNWMHVKYQSKLQAKKALSKNGKVFGNNMMVGVKQCIDKNFMSESGKENRPSTSSQSSEVPSPSPSSRKTPIRPLTAAYQAASSDLEVAGNSSNTPQKNNNLMSKAMEYVFGW